VSAEGVEESEEGGAIVVVHLLFRQGSNACQKVRSITGGRLIVLEDGLDTALCF